MIIPTRKKNQHWMLGCVVSLVLLAAWHNHAQPCYSCMIPTTTTTTTTTMTTDSNTSAPYSKSTLERMPELAGLSVYSATGVNADFCRPRFSPDFLLDAARRTDQYCAAPSTSQLQCFHMGVSGEGEEPLVSACHATGARWDPETRRFGIDCARRQDPAANAVNHVTFDNITGAWGDTGARYLLDRHMYLRAPPSKASPNTPRRTVLLVKREGNTNLWHTLMEVQSALSSLDVLRLAGRMDLPADAHNVWVAVLDDADDAATFDMYRFFSRNPVLWLGSPASDGPAVPFPLRPEDGPVDLVLPAGGGSNPLWRNDWADRSDCTSAPLVELMRTRVLAQFGVHPADHPQPRAADLAAKKVRVTFIDRRDRRRLVGATRLLAALQRAYPHALVLSLDFGAMTMQEQLQVVQNTDVLVGVHGAALTHAFFMQHTGVAAVATAVVELQPRGLNHHGFRNMAAMTGHAYHVTETEIVLAEEVDAATDTVGTRTAKDRHWQNDLAAIDEAAFLAVVGQAIDGVARRAAAYKAHVGVTRS